MKENAKPKKMLFKISTIGEDTLLTEVSLTGKTASASIYINPYDDTVSINVQSNIKGTILANEENIDKFFMETFKREFNIDKNDLSILNSILKKIESIYDIYPRYLKSAITVMSDVGKIIAESEDLFIIGVPVNSNHLAKLNKNLEQFLKKCK